MDSFLSDHLEPRWSRYGLRGDPFWSNALDPEEETTRPITLFRGRQTERELLVRNVLDGDHSATIIYAAGGHGKTTLANAAAFSLERRGYLILPEEIQYSPEDGTAGFFQELLRGILQALSDRGVSLPPPDDRSMPHLAEARQLVHFLKMKSGASAGAHAMGVGGERGVQYSFLRPNYEPTTSKRLLKGIIREIAAIDLVVEGILARINNLDVAALVDSAAVSKFFLEIRDLLQIDGIHWFMMGDTHVHDLVEDEPRVRSVFCEPMSLGPFDVADVYEILEARYEFMKVKGKELVAPVSADLVKALHEVHYGDLRNVLRDLRRAVQAVDPVEAIPVDAQDAMPLLEDLHFAQLSRRLKPEGWETLSAMAKVGQPVRQRDLAAQLGLTDAAVSTRFKRLQEQKAVELVSTEGRSQYWRLPGHIRLGLAGARRKELPPRGEE